MGSPGESESQPTLSTLPQEVLLAILDHLSPSSILRLGSTCSTLHEIATDEHLWQSIVLSLLATTPRHTSPASTDLSSARGGGGGESETWLQRAAFLLPKAPCLGVFISSTPYTSRVIRVSVSIPAPTLPLTIHAHQLAPLNALSLPSPPPVTLPHGCVLDPSGTSYSVPSQGPGSHSPDAGLSFDLLEPKVDTVPLFTVTRRGGTMSSSLSGEGRGRREGALTNSLRVKLVRSHVAVELDLAGEESEVEQRRRESQSMYALFTGRFPKIIWPTLDLLSVVNPTSRRVRSKGPMLGPQDWLTARGERQALITKEGMVPAFQLQILRRMSVAGAPATASASSTNEGLGAEEGRRRGVGPNGGPAILWNGRERDPTIRPVVTVVRAGGIGGEGPGGFVFHLPQIPTQHVTEDNVAVDTSQEEVVSTPQERFHAIESPPPPLHWDSPSSVDEQGDIRADSLEGLWMGTYGAHGIELGHVSVVLDRAGFNGGQVVRRLRYVKVTGDVNVPSGQVSWEANLDPDLPLYPPDSGTSPVSDNLGVVSTVTVAKLLQWSSWDPSSPAQQETPDWEPGSYDGLGRLALSGFVQPGWTSSTVTLIRSSHRVTREVVARDGSGEVVQEEKWIDSVEEIRLRWAELGKVSVFRRMRL